MILTSAAKQDKSGSCVKRQFLIFHAVKLHTLECIAKKKGILFYTSGEEEEEEE